MKKMYIGASIACFALLTACAGEDEIPMLTVESVSLYADLDANQNSATAIDLVLVYSTEVNKMIGKLSAAKYFQSATQLRRDNPTALDVWHWELVPGQSVENFSIDQTKGDAFDGYVFANFLSPGEHRIKVPPSGEVKVLLLKNDMKDLATLNVQNVTSGVSAPQPQHLQNKAQQQSDMKKSQQLSRSTSEFAEFDRLSKDKDDLGPAPYVFVVPGTVSSEALAPLNLTPSGGDDRKGEGVPPTATTGAPTASAQGTVYEMPAHGPETTDHTHTHPHEFTDVGVPMSLHPAEVAHTHEHGHPHPKVMERHSPVPSPSTEHTYGYGTSASTSGGVKTPQTGDKPVAQPECND